MIEDLGGVTSQLVKMAVDASVLNQKIIANNIANANTPGFTPEVSVFDKELAVLAGELLEKSNDSWMTVELKSLSKELSQERFVQESTEEKVQLDMEMARMSENVIRYQALLEGLSKYGSITKMAIRQEGIR